MWQSALPIKERETEKGGRPGFFTDAVKIERFGPFQAREAHKSGAAQRGGGPLTRPVSFISFSGQLTSEWLIGNTLVYSRSGRREVAWGRQHTRRDRGGGGGAAAPYFVKDGGTEVAQKCC